ARFDLREDDGLTHSRAPDGFVWARCAALVGTFVVLPVRIELTTSPLPRGCSTTELRQRRPHNVTHEYQSERGVPCHTGGNRASARRWPPPRGFPGAARD